MKRNSEDYRNAIFTEVCNLYEINISSLKRHNKDRDRKYVVTRQLIMYFVHDFIGINESEIGKIFAKDRTTFIHTKKTINNQCQTNIEFRRKVNYLRDQIQVRFDLLDRRLAPIEITNEPEILICL